MHFLVIAAATATTTAPPTVLLVDGGSKSAAAILSARRAAAGLQAQLGGGARVLPASLRFSDEVDESELEGVPAVTLAGALSASPSFATNWKVTSPLKSLAGTKL